MCFLFKVTLDKPQLVPEFVQQFQAATEKDGDAVQWSEEESLYAFCHAKERVITVEKTKVCSILILLSRIHFLRVELL